MKFSEIFKNVWKCLAYVLHKLAWNIPKFTTYLQHFPYYLKLPLISEYLRRPIINWRCLILHKIVWNCLKSLKIAWNCLIIVWHFLEISWNCQLIAWNCPIIDRNYLKLTSNALKLPVRMSGRSSRNTLKFSSIYISEIYYIYLKLLEITWNCAKLLQIASNYLKLPEIV